MSPRSNAKAAALLALPVLASSIPAVVHADDDCDAGELTSVSANPKAPLVSVPDALSPQLREVVVAQGSNALENPGSVTLANGTTYAIPYYGFGGDGPLVPAPGDLPSASHKVEASKTEPDKNTYLVLPGLDGADQNYDYGRHFLFQGHETGPAGYITRINLDADSAHRVTLLAVTDVNGNNLPTFDGSTWNPFAQRLLFSAEAGAAGGIWQATLDYPSKVEALLGSLGQGGYEGVQVDSAGNVWIVEDVGGKSGTANPHARQPNSFVYRFVPLNKGSLQRGKLQALQVTSLRSGSPIVFHAGQADADIQSDDILDLHTYGLSFGTQWVTIHDTEVDGSAPFNANALAKAKLATPFKRPENGVFRPGTGFREFFFSETGDTNALTEAGSAHGGFGAAFKITQSSPSANTGTLTLLYNCDVAHSGFDNVTFFDADHVIFVEDAGDTLHTQRNALDSAYLFDVRVNYASGAQPVRILAQGRDSLATIDAAFSGLAGFQNEGDNEITGIHMSDGDPSVKGLFGARRPTPFQGGFRLFYTQQHGENFTREVIPAPHGDDAGD